MQSRKILDLNALRHQALVKLLLALITVAFIDGCTTVPPLNFTPPDVRRSDIRLNAELRSTVVTVGRPDEKRGEIKFSMQYSQTIPELWKTGVEDALNRTLIFRDDGSKKVNLNIKILEWDIPPFGASFTTETTARYELVDRNDGTIYFSAEIKSLGTVPFDYAFVGKVRALESANRAVANNILLFLGRLKTANLASDMVGNEPAPRVSSLQAAPALAVKPGASPRLQMGAPGDSVSPPAQDLSSNLVSVSHVRLGVHCTQITASVAQTDHLPIGAAVRVVTVEAGSVAEAAGIHVGDVILKYGDRSLTEISDLTAAIAATAQGAAVPITIWRRAGESVLGVHY